MLVATVIGSTDSGASPSTTLPSSAHNQAPGHCIVVALETYLPSSAATITDTAGNNSNYVPVFSDNGNLGPVAGSTYVQLFYCKNCLGNTANVITVNQVNGGYSFATFYDIAGADLLTPLDVPSVVKGTGTGITAATATFSTAVANEIVIAVEGNAAGAGGPASAGSGYTLDYNQDVNVGATEHQIFTLSQSGIIAGMTLGSSVNWRIASAGFKAAIYSISGSAGVAGATISWTGTSSGSTTADGSGNYTISGLANGPYTITPSLAGYSFSPTSAAETVSGSNITGVNFTATAVVTVYSVIDSRNYGNFPNLPINVQGTETYTKPSVDSRKAGAPIDSRVNKPVDSRKAPNIPENSRTQPPFES